MRLSFLLPPQPSDDPTPTEKRRVLQKLGLDDHSLGGQRRKSLLEANSWLIFMSEVSTGKEWKKIVGDSIDRLKEQDSDKVVYRAYQYLCYAGQYDLPVPETLIAALDEHGYFYNLPEHPMSQGLIFHESRLQANIEIQDRLRIQHPVFAREALKSYRRHPMAILQDFVNAVQPNQREHRIFLCALLHASFTLDRSDRQMSMIQNLLKQQKKAIDAVLAASNISELLHHWEAFYGELGEHEKIKELKAIALTRPPQEAVDWLALFKLIERGGTQEQIDKLICDANDWLAANPQDHDVRGAYLPLVERKGDPEQIRAAIASTLEWLDRPDNRQDTEVRKTLLSLLKRKFNDRELIKAVIASTFEWLDRPDDRQGVQVRMTLLSLLVEFKGDDREQTESVINSTSAWLAVNLQDRQVRGTYLVLVRWKGTSEQAAEAMTATADWLDNNAKVDWLVSASQDQNVRKAYLGLVEERGDPKQIKAVIERTGTWLVDNPQDVEVRKTYLGLVERKGEPEQIRDVITATTDWLTDNPQDHEVRRTYLVLVKRSGTNLFLGEQIKAIITATANWLDRPDNRQDVEVRKAYLGLVEQQGEPEQITKAIDSTGSWLDDHPQDHEVLGNYLGLVERQGDEKQLALACNLAKKWLDHNPMTGRRPDKKYMWIFKGYERVLSKLERY